MADRGYVGKHRERTATPTVVSAPRRAGTRIAAAVAVLGTAAAVTGDVRTPATPSSPAVALHGAAGHAARAGAAERSVRAGTAGHTVRAGTSVRTAAGPGDLRLGRLTVHFEATRATTSAVAGDGTTRRLSWTVRVDNPTGATVTIGDPTAVLWATDGSGHVATSAHPVSPGLRRPATLSFELPAALEPSSITLTMGSAQAAVRVTSS